jgi:hypothetical protein
MRQILPIIGIILGVILNAHGQGNLSGSLQLNSSFYDNDPDIGTNTTQYQQELSSADGWLFLNYRIKGFRVAARFDAFHNSPLFNPQEAYSRQGLGFYSLSKDVGDLTITGGHFYEQFGNGIIFRAYEDRLLGIDNAVQGVRLNYDITKDLRVTAFTGKQKRRFDNYGSILKGANIEKDLPINDNFQLYPGFAVINRTLDDQTMNNIADEIRTYDYDNRFIPSYNVYAWSFYNQLNYKGFRWSLTYAGKTQEAIRSRNGSRFINEDGYALYSTISYSVQNLGINLDYRKNQTFVMKTTPYANRLRGNINFMPPVSKQHTRRLTGRYAPQARNYGEEAYQVDVTYSPGRSSTFNFNASYIKEGTDNRLFSAPSVAYGNLTNSEIRESPANKLYHEINTNFYHRWGLDLKTRVGIQTVNYDRRVYQGKPNANMVKTLTPYAEATYKLTRRQSLRTQFQYLSTKQDQGDFAFALLEYNIAPHYTLSVSDMVNTQPRKNGELKKDQDWVHYYSIFGSYTLNQTRFTAGYVKRVQGVVCTGGVCRVEPAFSGLEVSVSTNF